MILLIFFALVMTSLPSFPSIAADPAMAIKMSLESDINKGIQDNLLRI